MTQPTRKDVDIDGLFRQFTRIQKPGFSSTPIHYDGQRLKPNQKCPCGSDKKYKKCCQTRLESMARRKNANVVTQAEIDAIK